MSIKRYIKNIFLGREIYSNLKKNQYFFNDTIKKNN